ncbi:AraC family transcriptional regulator [Pararhodonellum marinum]|uniref:AraC family transcriptional regulator n=1 Tax=Pararhodonellum marinum TaxID=2755358 RepID=UPI00188F9D29|nr:helix-turn-helix domain-containing protein [Pararhodonellum marinum]
MNYQTFAPHSDLDTIVKCYWTLEVPEQKEVQRQLILPDGCVDMCFTLGDDIKRYISETDYIIQPRHMLLGQITEQFYIEPTGHVNTFAIRFYPYGFANFIDRPLNELGNQETPISELFDPEKSEKLSLEIIQAKTTHERINSIESFLFERLREKATINKIVKSTVDAMYLSNGSKPLNIILKNDLTKRRQLERNFTKQIGLSPKQLSKVIRLQATLQMLLNKNTRKLTDVAYENEYYDQAHFIKDFKEFTGITPKDFLTDDKMALSSLLYKKT